jgi:hypothetical protein
MYESHDVGMQKVKGKRQKAKRQRQKAESRTPGVAKEALCEGGREGVVISLSMCGA